MADITDKLKNTQNQLKQSKAAAKKMSFIKSEYQENLYQALKSKYTALLCKKERLRIEEIDAIQQETMSQMKTLNEQTILSNSELRKDFAWLDMGREIASLKVVLRETEQNLQSKVIENDKLKTHLSRMEDEVDNLSKSLELQAKLPRVDTVDKLNTPSIFTDRQISDYLPSSSHTSEGSKVNHNDTGFKDLFFQKLQNTYEVCKSISDNIFTNNSQQPPQVEGPTREDLDNLRAAHEVEILEIRECYEDQIEGLTCIEKMQQDTDTKVEKQKLINEMQLLSDENDQLMCKIDRLEIERDQLKDEVDSQFLVLQEISETKPSGILKNSYTANQSHFDNEMILKCTGFSILPSKLITSLINIKKHQIKSEHMLKSKANAENKLLDEIKNKSKEIQKLRSQLRSMNNGPNESITLNINQTKQFEDYNYQNSLMNNFPHQNDNVDEEIKDKLLQLEDENLDLRKQMNVNICNMNSSNSVLNIPEDQNKRGYSVDCREQDSQVISPLVEGVVYLSNKLALNESQSIQDNPSVEISQRVAIRALTNTLAKLVVENDISELNIEQFIPTRDDDKMSWYLDLLETQMNMTKEMVSDLKSFDLRSCIKDNQTGAPSKQLKAAYYELASNTKLISDQVQSISNTFYLIKRDLELKA